LGDTRIVTKRRREGNNNYGQEQREEYFYHGDHLGNVQLVTDYKGEMYEHFEYAPYGEIFVEDKARTDSTPFRFVGKVQDDETGLIYFGARYMSPQTGMWLSADPAMGEYVPVAPINDDAKKHNQNLPGMGGVFNAVNLHVYHYAGNNPVKYIDPDGRESLYKRVERTGIFENGAKFVREVLGVQGEKLYRSATFFRIPGKSGDSGVSLPKGFIGLGADIFSNPMGDRWGRNTLVHEVFHQLQYQNDSSAWRKLLDEFDMQNSWGVDVYFYGDLSKFTKLEDFYTYESQAAMVGDFAEYYYDARYGYGLSDDRKTKIKEMVRILDGSGFDTEAMQWVRDNL
jgi:RHS repeat-associated protein